VHLATDHPKTGDKYIRDGIEYVVVLDIDGCYSRSPRIRCAFYQTNCAGIPCSYHVYLTQQDFIIHRLKS